MNLDRETAVALLNEKVTTEHIIRHSYAVEAVMRKLAQKFDPENEALWAMSGLLHDLDNDLVDWQSNPSLHGPKTVEVLKEIAFGDETMYHAILAHNPATKTSINTTLDRCIYAGDPITGFINAIALVYPDKNIHSVKVKSITKRMKETRFAAGADREAMWSIETLMPFNEFAELALNAMKEISEEIGFPKPE
ncbi:MAG: HD domain-containing protein [Clostridia bacterium]|nr:HD domain-containing protein [Clostridia bacterium]